jgi:hypothetical protein
MTIINTNELDTSMRPCSYLAMNAGAHAYKNHKGSHNAVK